MAAHFVALATLFMQSQPELLAMLKEVAALHRYRRTHSREAVNHQANQCLIPQAKSITFN
jgi:hypothetical protein